MERIPAILLFDDGQGDLGPLSELRASFEQRTGGRTMLERASDAADAVHAVATPALAAAVAERMGTAARVPEAALCVNGRLHGTFEGVLASMGGPPHAGEAWTAPDGSVVAAALAGPALAAFVESVRAGRAALAAGTASRQCAARLWTRPWDLLEATAFGALLADDIAAMDRAWTASGERGTLPAHAACTGSEPVVLHSSAKVGQFVVFDTSGGPVLVGPGAQVGHGSVISGPAWIGPRTIVAERSVLKARTALGPQCRAAGEIGSAIFQGFSNKAHDGHLGDALLGEWVNLGAGTVNSNLLNTYGEVAMRLRPGAPLERTGRQFMGCIVGDHAKLAIGTRIMTGTSIGVGAMWAASTPATGTVDAFAWITDDGSRSYRLEKFMDVARTVMARRGLAPGEAVCARLAALHRTSAG